MNKSTTVMNASKPTSKHISGDGDGIKEFHRHPVPSSRKFTPSRQVNNSNQLRLELAIKELSDSKKGHHSSKNRRKEESVSLASPRTNGKTKIPVKKLDYNRTIEIYATPRSSESEDSKVNEAARSIFKYLLLCSWRKHKSLNASLSEALREKNDLVMQLNLQIYVLQNLRQTESSRRELMTSQYNEAQSQVDKLILENIQIKNDIESSRVSLTKKSYELNEVEEKLVCEKNKCDKQEKLIDELSKKCQKEAQEVKRLFTEKTEKNLQIVQYQNTIKIQNENIQNLKCDIESLKQSKQSLSTILEETQKINRESAEKLEFQASLIESYEFKIYNEQQEKEIMRKELLKLQTLWEAAQIDISNLKTKNESIQLQVENLSEQFEMEKDVSIRKKLSTTYFALKYLAQLILTAIQTNLTT